MAWGKPSFIFDLYAHPQEFSILSSAQGLEQDQMNELGPTVQVVTLALERLTREDHHKHEARLSSIVNSSLPGLHNNTLLKKERQLIQQ